jgi:hypothetical protein
MTVSFAQDTVVVIRAARVTDAYNNVTLDWDDAPEHDEPGCRWQPAGGESLHIRRDGLVINAALHAPPNADIEEDDRIRFNGTTYEIEGPIDLWRGVTGDLAHLEIALKTVKG